MLETNEIMRAALAVTMMCDKRDRLAVQEEQNPNGGNGTRSGGHTLPPRNPGNKGVTGLGAEKRAASPAAMGRQECWRARARLHYAPG